MRLTQLYFLKFLEPYRINHKGIYRLLEIGIFNGQFLNFVTEFFGDDQNSRWFINKKAPRLNYFILLPLFYIGILLYRHQIFSKFKFFISKIVKNDLNSISKINRFKRKLIRIIYSFIMLIALFLSIALIIPMFIEIPIMLGYINERNKHIIKTKKLEISKEFSKKEKDENILSHVKLSK